MAEQERKGNRILVVINYSLSDSYLVEKNLAWMKELDGCLTGHKLLLVTTDDVPDETRTRIRALGDETFGVCKQAIFKTKPWLVGKWPQVCNEMFRSANKIVLQQFNEPYFWCEPDCVPLKAGWLDELESEYLSCGKPFMGMVYDWINATAKLPHLTGCAIYPHNIDSYNKAILRATDRPWDVTAVHLTLPLTHRTELIQHEWGDRATNTAPTFPDRDSLKIISPKAAVFHRSKSSDLVDRLREKSPLLKRLWESVLPKPKDKVCSICYLPPPEIGNTSIFLENLSDFPPDCPVFYISDVPTLQPVTCSSIPPMGKFWTSDKIATNVFLHALALARKKSFTHFIYIETDCRFGKKNWDEVFIKAIGPNMIGGGNLAVCNMFNADTNFKSAFKRRFGKFPWTPSGNGLKHTHILGQKYPGHDPVPFTNGAPSIYSVYELDALFENKPIEALVEQMSNQDRSIGELAVKKYGSVRALEKWVHIPQVMSTAGEEIYPFQDRVNSLKNGTVAIHPIKHRWKPANKEGYIFHSSGDCGDIIFQLRSIELLGGGRLIVSPENKFNHRTRAKMTKESFNFMKPLVESQKYITSFEFSENLTDCTHDFNGFREFWKTPNSNRPSTLVEINAWYVGASSLFTWEMWLHGIEPKKIAPIVIHRSSRYHSDDFPWEKVLSKQKRSDMVFCGLVDEYNDFVKQFGHVPYYKPLDMLDMARVIRGAEMCVVNQSLPDALALGMAQNVFQETWKESPDCVFKRDNFFNQYKLPKQFV